MMVPNPQTWPYFVPSVEVGTGVGPVMLDDERQAHGRRGVAGRRKQSSLKRVGVA